MSNNLPQACFVIDEYKLRENLSKIQSIQNECDIEILFALKAFAGFQLFNLFKEYGFKGTASSVNELLLLQNSIGGKHHACVPVVTEGDILEYNEGLSHLVFNSIAQIEKYSSSLNKDIEIGLRINPAYSEVEVDLYNPALPHSRLGVFVDELPEILPKNVSGLHFHALCEL